MEQDRNETESLCPVCLVKIPAKIVVRENIAVLEKTCPTHGDFATPIWRGEPGFESWKRPKIPKPPPVTFTNIAKGCPFDCGLCPDHRQRSCTILIEVTQRCDLKCPVCYADSGNETKPDPSLDEIRNMFRAAWKAGPQSNIQLSGGEPTVRDDLPEIVAAGRESGFSFIQINTNGLRIAKDEHYIRALKDAGLASVFLQFDGVDDAIYRKLRGRNLLGEKLDAIRACERNRIGVVLTPVLVPGINDHGIGDILKKAMEFAPAVRSVHFQPISYFGRYFDRGNDKKRMTLPEIMRAIEKQTDGMFKAEHFKPPGCENALCSFHANFLVQSGGKVLPLQSTWDKSCCATPIKAEEGAAKAISYVARQWSAPAAKDIVGIAGPVSDGSAEAGCGCKCGDSPSPAMSLDDFIARARTHTLSVSAMAFQDAWNVDLNRVRDCCIHVMSPDRRLVPFCLYNLTSADGDRLYRP